MIRTVPQINPTATRRQSPDSAWPLRRADGTPFHQKSGRMPEGTRLSQQAAELLRVSALRASILSAGDK